MKNEKCDGKCDVCDKNPCPITGEDPHSTKRDPLDMNAHDWKVQGKLGTQKEILLVREITEEKI